MLWLLLACGSPGRWEECHDLTCRQATVEAAFSADGQGVLRWLAEATDPVEQVALTEQLVHAFPAASDDICGALPPKSAAASRCMRIRLRPHLYQRQPAVGAPSRSAPGPSTALVPVADLPAPKGEIGVDCGVDTECLRKRAYALATAGDAGGASAACAAAWPDVAARWECRFQSAERIAEKQGVAGLRGALALCSVAGGLAQPCTSHVLNAATPAVPGADHPSQAAVDEILGAVARVRADFPGDDGELYAQWLWSRWTRASFHYAGSVTGHLLTALPAEAMPHVRVAAAARYFALHPGASLEDAVEALAAVAPVEGNLPASAPEFTSAIGAMTPMWTGDLQGEGGLPATWCLTSGRRALASDPMDDLRVSVLEAAVRQAHPPPPQWFLDAIDPGAAEVVRWTAARLAVEVAGEAVPPGLSVPSDDSALVAGRLRMLSRQ